MFRFRLSILISSAILLFPMICSATSTLEISPLVIDLKGERREIFDLKFTVKSNISAKTTIFPIVVDEPFTQIPKAEDLDKARSLASWIQIRRGGIDILSGETLDIPLKIEFSQNAEPGVYHTKIFFADSNNIDGATNKFNGGGLPYAMINVELKAHIVERLEMARFEVLREVSVGVPVDFRIEIRNIGNQALAPKGSLDIYDRRDRLVTSIAINEEAESIESDAVSDFPLSWNPGASVGKYKAKLNIEYGTNDGKNLQDLLFFWVTPWYLLAIVGALVVLIILLVIFLNRRSHYYYQEPRSPFIDLRSRRK